ncbi:hypothetical protein [Streptomyces sp. UNOC14_S4]|uniref:hypothetical protein n=1 Tax=Streptomyces sp. UNOC14_S4 TaxID=2872340 RepID=UPI001E6467F8|nr:hypothetical protein [Streptomyces sp. UNOC14_S4]MCC3768377.1 hypothetical protein [Streptomyces sp. UNOC14_S4]
MVMSRTVRSGRSTTSRAAGLVASVALAGAGLVLPAAPAQAATGDLSCAVTGSVTFSPALTPTRTSTKGNGTGKLSNCISGNGNFSRLQSADIAVSGPATADPSGFAGQCPALINLKVTGTFSWQDGEKSGVSFTLSDDIAAGKASITGTVTKGPLKGDTVTAAPVFTVNTDCATAGLSVLTAQSGAVEFS